MIKFETGWNVEECEKIAKSLNTSLLIAKTKSCEFPVFIMSEDFCLSSKGKILAKGNKGDVLAFIENELRILPNNYFNSKYDVFEPKTNETEKEDRKGKK